MLINNLARFPQFFWNLKAFSFNKEEWQNKIFPQHYWLLAKIKKLKPNNILEVGCGFGRNLEFLLKNNVKSSQLTGSDFSLIMLNKAKTRLNNKVKLIKAPVQKLPFKDNSFDLVFTHGVLMHLKPNQLKKALSELTRVTNKWLILIEEIRDKPVSLNSFTWAHDYEKIVKKSNLKVLKKHLDKKLPLIWYLLKKQKLI